MGSNTINRPDETAMNHLLKQAGHTTVGLILRLAWRQGLTREEIQRLTWADLAFAERRIHLPDRVVPLEEETAACLQKRQERMGKRSPFVVVSDRRRQQMPPESISRLARTALDQAGITGVSLMDLRHDFIIRQLESHDWPYQEAVTVIAGLGIVDGYSDGSFGPGEALTRGAAAKII